MTKQFYVSSAVQAILLKEVLLPEMSTGFWKDHRPADHAAQWADVEILVSDSDKLGAVDFTVPRLYNFINPDFIKPNEALLIAMAQRIKPGSNFRSVKKELIELNRIIGNRLTDKNSLPSKANRGNNKTGALQETSGKPKTDVKKTVVKKTVVKKTVKKDPNIITQKTSSGATVHRMPVTRVDEIPETEVQTAD